MSDFRVLGRAPQQVSEQLNVTPELSGNEQIEEKPKSEGQWLSWSTLKGKEVQVQIYPMLTRDGNVGLSID